MELKGVGCALCQIIFGPGFAVPCVKSTIYVCYGIILHKFVYSLCNTCYTKNQVREMEKVGDSGGLKNNIQYKHTSI